MTKIHPLAEEFYFQTEISPPKFNILLLHGFTASPSEIKPFGIFVYEFFKREINVFSLLLPGHGIDGNNGFKSLDRVSYKYWISSVENKVNYIKKNNNSDIILFGLSMGSLLVCEYLSRNSDRIKGAIILSPPFFLKSKLFPLAGVFKYVLKYTDKSKQSKAFFEKNRLFSYQKRSLHGVNEFKKIVSLSRESLHKVNVPLIAFLPDLDEIVNNIKVESFLNRLKIENHTIPGMNHILTVDKNIDPWFEKISFWITNLIE